MFVRKLNTNAQRGTLLYIHGLGESRLCFEHLPKTPELSGYSHLLVDLPGYGRSPWQNQPLSLQEQSDHLATWLKENNEKDITLIGHSMGGVIGLLFAEKYPELLRAFINVDGNLSLEDCTYSKQAIEMGFEKFISGGFDEMRNGFFKQGLQDRALRGYYTSTKLCDPRSYFKNSEELVEISKTEQIAVRMSKLDIPVHFIAGVPGGISKISHELLQRAKIQTTNIEPSGHWPFIDRPQDFVAALSGILNKI